MKKIENMVLIGSTGRNSGKTTLACKIIEELKNTYSITALKITTIKGGGGIKKCPRGGAGCGACSIRDDFVLSREEGGGEESGVCNGKDTSLLLRAGAKKVFWLRCLREKLEAGFDAFLQAAGDTDLIICESNSLRLFVEPELFIMLCNNQDGIKKSAEEVMDYADIKLDSARFFQV